MKAPGIVLAPPVDGVVLQWGETLATTVATRSPTRKTTQHADFGPGSHVLATCVGHGVSARALGRPVLQVRYGLAEPAQPDSLCTDC